MEDGELLLQLVRELDEVAELRPELDHLSVLVEDAPRLVANEHSAELAHDQLAALELVALRAEGAILRATTAVEATAHRRVVLRLLGIVLVHAAVVAGNCQLILLDEVDRLFTSLPVLLVGRWLALLALVRVMRQGPRALVRIVLILKRLPVMLVMTAAFNEALAQLCILLLDTLGFLLSKERVALLGRAVGGAALFLLRFGTVLAQLIKIRIAELPAHSLL